MTYVELLPEREGDAYAFLCESAPNTDMRKSLFYTCAERGWPILGLEPIGMSLEDVFIRLKINITKVNTQSSPDGIARLRFGIEVRGADLLGQAVKEVLGVKGVISARRS